MAGRRSGRSFGYGGLVGRADRDRNGGRGAQSVVIRHNKRGGVVTRDGVTMSGIGSGRIGCVAKVPEVTLNGAVRVRRSSARETDRQRRYSACRRSRSAGHRILLGPRIYDGPGDLILPQAVVIGVTGRDGIAAPHAV